VKREERRKPTWTCAINSEQTLTIYVKSTSPHHWASQIASIKHMAYFVSRYNTFCWLFVATTQMVRLEALTLLALLNALVVRRVDALTKLGNVLFVLAGILANLVDIAIGISNLGE
jgi:hypothetical protein